VGGFCRPQAQPTTLRSEFPMLLASEALFLPLAPGRALLPPLQRPSVAEGDGQPVVISYSSTL
jgi:hypothetical protein